MDLQNMTTPKDRPPPGNCAADLRCPDPMAWQVTDTQREGEDK
jgi:hypothetical protein